MGIDWNLGYRAPDDSVAAALQAFGTGRQLALQHRQDTALSVLSQNPDDPAAQNALIAANPDVGFRFQKATMERSAMQRGMAARSAAADYIRATAPGAQSGYAQPPSGQPGAPDDASRLRPVSALDPTHPAAQAIGAAAAQGQILSPTDAMARMVQFDPDTAKETLALVGTMTEQHRTQVADMTQTLGSAAHTILQQIPMTPGADPQQVAAQRRAAAMSMLPQLAMHGVTPQMVQQADYSDTGLQGIMGSALGLKGAIDTQQKAAEIAETGRHNLAGETEAAAHDRATERASMVKNVQPGEQVVDLSGGGGTGGGGSSGGGAIALDGNNPGGIVDGGFAKSQPGYQGANGRFAKFATIQDGINAQTALLRSYVARGFDTPAKIANRWAPAGDGNNNPSQYAANIAKAMGIGVDDKVTPAQISAFQTAQATQENGMYGQRAADAGVGPRVLFSNGAGTISDDGARLAAAIYKIKGTLPPQIGRTKGDVDKIMNLAANMPLDQAHQIADGTIRTWQDTQGAGQAITAFDKGRQGDQARSFNVAIQHLDLYREAAQALQNGNIPLFNSISQAIGRATGQAAPTNAQALHDLVLDETTKGVLGTAGGVGDRASASRIAGQAGSPAQIVGAIDQLQHLMAGQAQGLGFQYHAATGRNDFADRYLMPRTRQVLGVGGSQSGGGVTRIANDNDFNRLPSGARFIGPDGKLRTKP